MVLTEKVNAPEAVLIPGAFGDALFCRPPLRGSLARDEHSEGRWKPSARTRRPSQEARSPGVRH